MLLLATAKVQIPPATSNEGTTFLPVEAQHSASSWSQALTARAPAPPKPPCYSQGCPQLGSYQSSLPAAPPPAFQPCHCWGAAVCTVCHHLGSSRTGLPCTNQAAEHRNSYAKLSSPGAETWHFCCLFLIVICLPELSI